MTWNTVAQMEHGKDCEGLLEKADIETPTPQSAQIAAEAPKAVR